MELTLHTEFPAIQSEWNALLDESISHVPFLRYEYLETWWHHRGGGEWPNGSTLAIVTARREGELVAIAPLFHAPDHRGKPALLLLGSVEISDYLDLIVCPDDLQAFADALLPFLRGAGLPAWEALDLFNVLDSSPSLGALKTAAEGLGWGFTQEKEDHCPYIPLPGDWEAYLASIDKKQRHEIRRKLRRAEAAPFPPAFYLTEDSARLEEDIEAFLGMMRQDTAKAEFLTEPMTAMLRDAMRCAFDADCLHLSFLTFGEHKAAAYLSFNYLDRLWVYNSGYDSRFLDYSPGWVLLGLLLEWANNNGIQEFDFMQGDEDYKYRFGAVDRLVLRATLTPGG